MRRRRVLIRSGRDEQANAHAEGNAIANAETHAVANGRPRELDETEEMPLLMKAAGIALVTSQHFERSLRQLLHLATTSEYVCIEPTAVFTLIEEPSLETLTTTMTTIATRLELGPGHTNEILRACVARRELIHSYFLDVDDSKHVPTAEPRLVREIRRLRTLLNAGERAATEMESSILMRIGLVRCQR